MVAFKRFQSVAPSQRARSASAAPQQQARGVTNVRHNRRATTAAPESDDEADTTSHNLQQSQQSTHSTSRPTQSVTFSQNPVTSYNDDDDPDNGEVDTMPLSEKTVLCMTSFMGKIGCSYYNPNERKLYLIEDSPDSSKFDLAMSIIEQVQPHLTLVSNRSDPELIEGLKVKLSELTDRFTPTVEVRSNREFVANQGRSQLLDLPLLSTDDELDAGQQDGNDDLVDTDLQRNRDAYSFMRLRNRQKSGPRTAEQKIISNLKLGGSLLQDMDKSLETVACLISYINRRRNINTEGADEGGIDITSIELIALSKTMMINADALAALQIFDDANHANVHSNAKTEGLSIFRLLSRTRTPLGKALLKRWMLQPSLEIDVLEKRFDAVDCFSKSDNLHVSDNMQKSMNVKHVPRTMKALQSGYAHYKEWQALSDFLGAAVRLKTLTSDLIGSNDVAILKQFHDAFETEIFTTLQDEIEMKIDWTESAEQHRVCIKEAVDQRLDDNRRVYQGLPSMLSKVAEHISGKLEQDFCTSLNVVYFPQLGYLCATPIDEEVGEGPDARAPKDWTEQFKTEVSVYYKTPEMRDLDEYLGDLHGFILDREVELVQEMLEKIMKHAGTFDDVSNIIAEMDVLLAFADASRQFGWSRPFMSESNICRIDAGRHPLVEMVVDNFVKNDAQLVGGRGISPEELDRITSKPDVSSILRRERKLEARRQAAADASDATDADLDDANDSEGEDDAEDSEDEHLLSPDDSILVLTGANASGKSVFLKMVAIIVYMAHIGCFVPAETAVIGLTDRILTRVSTRESVSRNTSAFMIDLQQVSFMLRNCTARSLLLIDEFGKGTNASDGAGLFIGLLKHLVTLGSKLPKTLLATHFHEIFFSGNNFLRKGLPIGLAHMELIIDKKDFEHNVTRDEAAVKKFEMNKAHDKFEEMKRVTHVTPLFVLCPGLCLKSYAFHCAGSYGIAQPIIDRAVTVAQALSTFNMHEIMDPQMRPEDESTLRESENIVRRLLQMSWDDDDEDDIDPTTGRRRSTMSKLAECLGEPWTEPQGEIATVQRR